MKYYRRITDERRENIFSNWELRFLMILIILVVMLSIIDLGLSFDQVLKFII